MGMRARMRVDLGVKGEGFESRTREETNKCEEEGGNVVLGDG